MLDKMLFSVAYAGLWNRWDGFDDDYEYDGGDSIWSLLPYGVFLIVSVSLLWMIFSKFIRTSNETAGVCAFFLSVGLMWQIPPEAVRFIGCIEFFAILIFFFPKFMSAVATLYAVPFGCISLLAVFRGDFFNIITGTFVGSVVIIVVARWWSAIKENNTPR